MAAVVSGMGTASGETKVVPAFVALDASYPAGGYTVDFSTLGIRDAQFVSIEDSSGYMFAWDRVNRKLLAYTAASTEVANATDLSAITALGVLVVGQP